MPENIFYVDFRQKECTNIIKSIHGSSLSPHPPFHPLILEGDLKISDQKNWGGGGGGDLSKKSNLGGS